MEDSARDQQIITGAKHDAAERRFQCTFSFADVHDLIALRIAVKSGAFAIGPNDRKANVVVEQERNAIGDGVSRFGQLTGSEMAMTQRLGRSSSPRDVFQFV